MNACCVDGCSGPTTPNPVYFEFPTSRLLRKRWLEAIKCDSAPDSGSVCILHFSRADYELVRGEARLRSRVVPCRKIPGENIDDSDSGSESDSSESATSDRTQDKTKTDNRNDDISNKDNRNNEGITNDCNNDDTEARTKDLLENGPDIDDLLSFVETIHTENIGNRLSNKDNIGTRDNCEMNVEYGKINFDNEKISDDNRNINDGNRKTNDDSEKTNDYNGKIHDNSIHIHEDSRNINTNDGNINVDNGKVPEDDGKINEDNGKLTQDKSNITEDNTKITDVNGKITHDNGKRTEDNGKLTQDNSNVTGDNTKITDDNGKITDDHRKRTEDNGKLTEDNSKITENNGKVTQDNVRINDDSENSNKKVQGRKTRCKITALRAINGRRKFSFSSDSTNSEMSNSPRPELESNKEDIEESLQHYYIENKKTERQVAAMTDVINEEEKRCEEAGREGQESEPSQPVFIELSVGQGSTREGQENTESDCLMLLESVQCDVDPTLLLAAREEDEENMEQVDLAGDDDDDDDDVQVVEKKKEDPISLLTSSDEDEVIIQEPKYDLVEVSSADTSEDDMPLVRLVKPSRSSQPDAKKLKLSAKHTKNLITKLLWGRKDFYCVQCQFTSVSASEYTKHLATHTNASQKIIQYCHDCGFTTSSKQQMLKHKQKHKNEKRFKCQSCNYSAKHKMSLVYHMKTHQSSFNEVELAICGTYDPSSEKSGKSKTSERSKMSEKRYKCKMCGYKTNRRSDMKRHKRRIHDANDDDDDDEYVP